MVNAMKYKDYLKKHNIGPTGKYPQGKILPDDFGELKLAVSSWRGEVRIDFGVPVSWFTLPPDTAREFANTILKYAGEAKTK